MLLPSGGAFHAYIQSNRENYIMDKPADRAGGGRTAVCAAGGDPLVLQLSGADTVGADGDPDRLLLLRGGDRGCPLECGTAAAGHFESGSIHPKKCDPDPPDPVVLRPGKPDLCTGLFCLYAADLHGDRHGIFVPGGRRGGLRDGCGRDHTGRK